MFQTVVQWTVQMPQKQHSLRKPRHGAAFARLGTVFDANDYDNPLRTHESTTSRPSSRVKRRNDRSQRSNRKHTAVDAAAAAAISTHCVVLAKCMVDVPYIIPGHLTGWGTQYVVPIRATRKWCLILIGREHVTANSWLFCWE